MINVIEQDVSCDGFINNFEMNVNVLEFVFLVHFLIICIIISLANQRIEILNNNNVFWILQLQNKSLCNEYPEQILLQP